MVWHKTIQWWACVWWHVTTNVCFCACQCGQWKRQHSNILKRRNSKRKRTAACMLIFMLPYTLFPSFHFSTFSTCITNQHKEKKIEAAPISLMHHSSTQKNLTTLPNKRHVPLLFHHWFGGGLVLYGWTTNTNCYGAAA